jgi:hypothetical protein
VLPNENPKDDAGAGDEPLSFELSPDDPNMKGAIDGAGVGAGFDVEPNEKSLGAGAGASFDGCEPKVV